MKRFADRLNELKKVEKIPDDEVKELLKNKGIKVALNAWDSLPKKQFEDILVNDDITLDGLWKVIYPEQVPIFKYASILNITQQEAIKKIFKLKDLGLIYPDRTISIKIEKE